MKINFSSESLPYFFGYKMNLFVLPTQSQKSRSILLDRSRSLGLFRKGKPHIIAKFHKANLVICSHSGEGKTLFYSQITVAYMYLTCIGETINGAMFFERMNMIEICIEGGQNHLLCVYEVGITQESLKRFRPNSEQA